jgi:hypothetical protein
MRGRKSPVKHARSALCANNELLLPNPGKVRFADKLINQIFAAEPFEQQKAISIEPCGFSKAESQRSCV